VTDNRLLEDAFADLSTALIADACVRLKIALRVASPDIRPLLPGMRVAGRVLPPRHRGSVDVFRGHEESPTWRRAGRGQ